MNYRIVPEHDRRDAPPWIWPRAAYIHIPFCAHQCGYCDFAIAVGRDDQFFAYLDALEAELESLESPQPVDTIFLGGGTPTFLDSRSLERLIELLRHWLPLQRGGECSIEANPDDITPEKARLLRQAGVTRVSLGVQSFNDELLAKLDRRHRSRDVFRAVELLASEIGNVAVDLIFGVPDQSLDQWKADLQRAVSLEVNHISTYGLTYEKGTPLWKRREAGEVAVLEESDELAMYRAGMEQLADHGFFHYEISNYARPGWECRHNHVYWANHAYFGFGMGAARYVAGVRETNTRELAGYLRKATARENPAFQSESLAPRDRAYETLAIQLRRTIGIERPSFRLQTGFELDELVGPPLSNLAGLGLVRDSGEALSLTPEGKCVADAVAMQLLKAD